MRRRLNDGSAFRILKVPHTATGLEERLRDLGWEIDITDSGSFYWGAGGRRNPPARGRH